MHRILFVVPIGNGIPIFGYGLFMMLGFVVGLSIACYRAKKMGLPKDSALDVGLISIFCGVIGARLAYLLIDYVPNDSDGIAEWFAVWNGGLTFQGGLVLALAGAGLYLWIKKISWGKMFDAYAPGLAVGVGFGRLGCLMNGCCWGKAAPASCSFSMLFPLDIEPMAAQLRYAANWPDAWATFAHNLGYPVDVLPPIPLYPVQVMSAIGLFLIGIGLVVAERIWTKRRDGQVILWFVYAYSIGRFLIEFLRDDTPLRYGFGAFPGLRLGQWLALACLIIAVFFQIRLNRQAAKERHESIGS